ncbi:histidinol-phosphate transaminase [Thiohalophilus thiocyanatoxydans]|uniref:Histidinol-phosphate aminotransferase n=1 Tax=Thiohalophilus thiocyanatoxydans TaxID=381308 RepID=A0A4R8IP18_9GAMM|nr:histidinol-phosphate transaminase [Thiohalophilus thiocyanatoxydans]TDY02651.1 histidinol-phosphate aminotransferase [Thiohalophilus thiocyanatoxydans]
MTISTEQFDVCDLAAPGVRELTPYQPGKPIEELEREYGLSDVIKLASNENPLGPSPDALTAIRDNLAELSRYPDGNGFILKQALCNHFDLDAAQITLGNGSNDVLELIARAFVTPDNEVVFSQHAFAVYPLVTRAIGARAVVTPARAGGHDLEAILGAITDRTRLVFIANPNNPTGTWLTRAALQAFLEQVPPHVLVVLDEAYYEYAADPATGIADYPDGLQWLATFPNLIVTRTFSKAYGLAGLRIGYAVSHPEVADYLNRVRQPFNVNHLALAAVSAALTDTAHLQRGIALNVRGLQQYYQAFDQRGLDYFPSAGNFVTVRVGPAAEINEQLLRRGIIVRPVANYDLPEHLRISIGSEKENRRCIDALDEILQAGE